MTSPIRQLILRIRKTGKPRPKDVMTRAMGRERNFRAYDLGADTFIFEDEIRKHLDERPAVLIVRKRDLGRRGRGYVLTMSTGNHSVAAFPLLDGRFWQLAKLSPEQRGEVLMGKVLCSNVIGRHIETSQRDVPSDLLYKADAWLLGTCGLALNDVIMGDRNTTTLEHYRASGQEWRVKPLAWTEAGMRCELAAAKRRIASSLGYYHSARGVHFLTLPEFRRFAALAVTDSAAFEKGMRELASIYEGQPQSFTRLPKYRGHHEIELFGMRRGEAVEKVVPELDRLMESIVIGHIGAVTMAARAEQIVELWQTLLAQPELADETSPKFIASLYMHVTGEIYNVQGDGSTPSFDDRRTALPGATFVNGRPVMHPGADARTEILLSNLRRLMSKDEIVTSANVYELREEESALPVGEGRTREVVYRTSCRPLEQALIEKRLSSPRKNYTSYMVARIGALRALGVSLSPYYLMLQRRFASGKRAFDYYIRTRCEGESLATIPQSYFRNADDASVEEKDSVLALAQLMGDAAAQNMAMKKYDPKTGSPLFGVGKEIYEFEYDIVRQRVVPKTVRTCSIRGSFGWPDLSRSEENLAKMASFYLGYFAHALKAFQRDHQVTMLELAERFWDGFEFRTHALAWQLSVMRDQFETFRPPLPRHFSFAEKWSFIMWSLVRQERRLEILKDHFYQKVEIVAHEDIRNNPQ